MANVLTCKKNKKQLNWRRPRQENKIKDRLESKVSPLIKGQPTRYGQILNCLSED